jgi:RND family efflux transporter MFP subunit
LLKKLYANKFLKIAVLLVVIGGIGFTGYGAMNKSKTASSETVTTREETVTRGDITIGFTGDGEAEIPVINLDFSLSGKIKEIHVKNGDQIQEGQVLAKLDDTEYQNKLRTAELSYNKAVATLEQKEENTRLNLISEKQKLDEAQRQIKQIEIEYLPMLELEDYYSPQEIELKKMSYESAKAAYDLQVEQYNALLNANKDVELERVNVESAQINLEMAKNDLDNTVLKSPVSATVLNLSYKAGESFSPPSTSGKATADTSHFIVVSDADKIEVVVPVSEMDLPKVEIGQTVEVAFEAHSGETYMGKVTVINALPKIDSNGLVTYDVRIELDGTMGKIKSGMTCTVDFILRQEKNVLIIPNKAVSMVDGKQVVKVKGLDGNLQVKNIKTGLTDGKNVAVTDGLEVGETVVIETKKSE